MNRLHISLCMIVKNEEQSLGKCLQSACAHVDEIIIVDTGSSDRTIEIASQYTDRIFHYQWDGSFAAARNYSLEQASCQWIMWLDADEVLVSEDNELLRNQLVEADEALLSVAITNAVGESDSGEDTFLYEQTRIFRNQLGLQFRYSIHEMLHIDEVVCLDQWKPIRKLPFMIMHHGYLKQQSDPRQKHQRNMDMLLRAIKSSEEHPWLEFHLANEYYRCGHADLAVEWVNRSILRFIHNGKLPPSMLYKLKYAALLTSGKYEEAGRGIDKAIELHPDYPDLHFVRGILLWRKELYQESLSAFDRCIEVGETNLTHLIEVGQGSFKAWYYKGLCYEKMGLVNDALRAWKQAVTPAGSFPPAVEAMNRVLEK